ncbi:MAG TPA: HAMP domain-containing sensor histidine kinase [Haliangiales bacterium]|nr:HAMP domain-containing sensor histidine kinase [Haliangiales bacterium]
MKFRTPANVLLRRAQLILILVALLPTILTAPVGLTLLFVQSSPSVTLVGGILVVAFCTSSLVGYILGSIFVSRGASLAKVQNDFLSSVSHELMTPITSVRMFIDTLRDERVTDPAEKAKCLEIIDREMSRLDGLLQKLIALSKLESGRQPFEIKPVRVADIVSEAVGALDAVRLGQRVDVHIDVPGDLEVIGDQPSLVQALANLLTNAFKYGDREIRVAARALPRSHVEIAVSDNGPGIPEDEKRRIFEEFERGRAATGRVQGFGLGLAIVRAIVRAHHGRVEVDSPPGAGATFTLVLESP